MKRNARWSEPILGISLTLLVALTLAPELGCAGQKVRALSIFDARLPPESRRWVADANDQIVIATAARDEAQARFQETLVWQAAKVTRAKWSAKGTAASHALAEFAKLRVRLAKLDLKQSEASYVLTMAKWTQIMAETAMRHDISVYDLKPIAAKTKAARAEVKSIGDEIETLKLEAEKAEAKWWKAFSDFTRAGGKGEVLWVSQ